MLKISNNNKTDVIVVHEVTFLSPSKVSIYCNKNSSFSKKHLYVCLNFAKHFPNILQLL